MSFVIHYELLSTTQVYANELTPGGLSVSREGLAVPERWQEGTIRGLEISSPPHTQPLGRRGSVEIDVVNDLLNHT